MPDFKAAMEHFLKAGEFRPEHINVGNTLRPEESDRYIDLIVKSSDFLKQITVEKCSKLIKDVNVWEFIQEVLQRVPEGDPPPKYTNFKNVGKQLHLAEATLYSFLGFSFFEDNQKNPGIESLIEGRLAATYARDIVRMGFVGQKDDNSGGFSTLNKGWIELVKSAANSKKVDIAGYQDVDGVTDWSGLLSAVIRELPEIYKSDSAAIVMNRADHEEYAEQIGSRVAAHPVLFSGQPLTPLGYKIVLVEHMPRKHVLFTPLLNLVFGHGRDVQRFRELSGVKRCINYTVTSYFDYEVAVDEAAVLAWKQ